jgi:hypothetical protein
MACEVAAAARVGRLILFHHDPSYADDVIAGMEKTAKNLFVDSISAYEGLEIDLTPGPASAGKRESMSVRLQTSAAHGRDVQYAQNG